MTHSHLSNITMVSNNLNALPRKANGILTNGSHHDSMTRAKAQAEHQAALEAYGRRLRVERQERQLQQLQRQQMSTVALPSASVPVAPVFSTSRSNSRAPSVRSSRLPKKSRLGVPKHDLWTRLKRRMVRSAKNLANKRFAIKEISPVKTKAAPFPKTVPSTATPQVKVIELPKSNVESRIDTPITVELPAMLPAIVVEMGPPPAWELDAVTTARITDVSAMDGPPVFSTETLTQDMDSDSSSKYDTTLESPAASTSKIDSTVSHHCPRKLSDTPFQQQDLSGSDTKPSTLQTQPQVNDEPPPVPAREAILTKSGKVEPPQAPESLCIHIPTSRFHPALRARPSQTIAVEIFDFVPSSAREASFSHPHTEDSDRLNSLTSDTMKEVCLGEPEYQYRGDVSDVSNTAAPSPALPQRHPNHESPPPPLTHTTARTNTKPVLAKLQTKISIPELSKSKQPSKGNNISSTFSKQFKPKDSPSRSEKDELRREKDRQIALERAGTKHLEKELKTYRREVARRQKAVTRMEEKEKERERPRGRGLVAARR